ncbi:putative lipid II flippase FtsW [Texcoconibacillus texcoconensis]|uniref:Probable peptidoglycan glycosyltransferase FtsW n=1 Tax=Texcoconibacillus texcoconensis TaxID=1095777 RepID=A0A840QN57_9BACI|nr:putative lipid II flippase FtsW [Texcoconibacillus texcoconensis]MBB5172806.1 cell division protein FtsW [Texcoconibacillus texcoconensis]
MNEEKRRHFDWTLLIVVALLSLFGLVIVYSASYVLGFEFYDNFTFYFQRHLVWIIISFMLLFFFAFFPYRRYKKLAPILVLASVFILLFVFIPGVGHDVNGAQRWIRFGGFTIQPSEFIKLTAIMYLAYVYSRKQSYIDDFLRGVFPPLCVIAVFFVLILMQPDLGTATSIVIVSGLIVFCSGARTWHLFAMSIFGVSVVAYYAFSEDYRWNRIAGFMDPFASASGDGYQLIQSYMAIAHGGLSGAGLGQSVQKLFYLPEAHTDFILAIVSEELGFLGVTFVFGAIGLIILRGLLIGLRCPDTFGSLLAFGISFQLAIQVIFNAGAVSGVLPITGIPFPFLSYGGSSLIVTFIFIGILLNIDRYNGKMTKEESRLEEREESSVSAKSDISQPYIG